MKWEYKRISKQLIHSPYTSPIEEIIAILNEAGAVGWEVIERPNISTRYGAVKLRENPDLDQITYFSIFLKRQLIG